jgi:hypothetical protein
MLQKINVSEVVLLLSSSEGRHLLCWVPWKELTSMTGIMIEAD